MDIQLTLSNDSLSMLFVTLIVVVITKAVVTIRKQHRG